MFFFADECILEEVVGRKERFCHCPAPGSRCLDHLEESRMEVSEVGLMGGLDLARLQPVHDRGGVNIGELIRA